MEPTTGLIVKTAAWFLSHFKTFIIERWSRRRAELFFQTFVERYAATDAAGQPLSNIEPLLAELLEDERKSEVLWEAYRRVCLSASASLGPRIIAVLTARIVAEGRFACPEEERMMMACESLSDEDFGAMCSYLIEHSLKNGEVELLAESEDSNWRRGSIALGQVNLGDYVGNWCLKIANAGLVVQDISKASTDYDEDSERHIDETGTLTTYTWKLRFQPEVIELKDIITSLGGNPAAT